MKAELFDKWVDALTNGKFKQISDRLSRVTNTETGECGHCVMGVLCDVAEFEKKIQSNGTVIFDGQVCSLTDEQLKRVGFTKDMQSEFIRHNDRDKVPFDQLAAFLREKRSQIVEDEVQTPETGVLTLATEKEKSCPTSLSSLIPQSPLIAESPSQKMRLK